MNIKLLFLLLFLPVSLPMALTAQNVQSGSHQEVANIHSIAEFKLGSYDVLRRKLPPGVQANHLNQDAAFRNVIPRSKGAAIALTGDAVRDIGSQHYLFHQSLEMFWNQYRRGGKLFGLAPTVGEYNVALSTALQKARLTNDGVAKALRMAIRNQMYYGLNNRSIILIPERMHQNRR